MGWFEGGEGSPNSGGGGGDMPAGPKLVLIMLIIGALLVMTVAIGSFGFMGLIYGVGICILGIGFLGMIYGD